MRCYPKEDLECSIYPIELRSGWHIVLAYLPTFGSLLQIQRAEISARIGIKSIRTDLGAVIVFDKCSSPKHRIDTVTRNCEKLSGAAFLLLSSAAWHITSWRQ